MLAAVVQHAKPAAVRLVRNVRVAPGDRLIGVARSLEKRHVVGSHEPVPAVSNLRTAADVDAHCGVEGIRLLFGRALEHGQLEPGHRRRTRGLGRRPRALRDPRELDVERRVAPVLPRLGLVRDRDIEVVDLARRASRGSPRCDRATTAVGEDRFEACPRITRRREDRERDGVERKDPAAAAARLDLLLHRLDNGVNDLERLARPGRTSPPTVRSRCRRAGLRGRVLFSESPCRLLLSGRRASPRVQGRSAPPRPRH